MAQRHRRPMRMAGAVTNSGFLDTGEVRTTIGGEYVATAYSGAIAVMSGRGIPICSGGHAVIYSGGPGRLKQFAAIFGINLLSGATAAGGNLGMLSGQPIVVYDAVQGQRSGILADGTLVESGARIMYAWGAPLIVSGITGVDFRDYHLPVQLDQPFYSGLCVMALSGAPGFTLSYTPEANRSGLSDEAT